jgi:hypothetical protein
MRHRRYERKHHGSQGMQTWNGIHRYHRSHLRSFVASVASSATYFRSTAVDRNGFAKSVLRVRKIEIVECSIPARNPFRTLLDEYMSLVSLHSSGKPGDELPEVAESAILYQIDWRMTILTVLPRLQDFRLIESELHSGKLNVSD